MDQIHPFEDDLQVEQEAMALDPSSLEQLANFIASVAMSPRVGNSAVAAARTRLATFKNEFGEQQVTKLTNLIYKHFRTMRRAGQLPSEELRLGAETMVEAILNHDEPN